MPSLFAARAKRPVTEIFAPWGICVLESHHATGFQMPDTAHPFFKLMFVLDGAGAVVAARPAPLRKGDVVVVPAGYRHRIEDDPQAALALIVLCVKMDVLKHASDLLPVTSKFRVLRSPALTLETRRALRQLFFEQSLNRNACASMMIGVVLQLLAVLSRAQHPRGSATDGAGDATGAPELRVIGYVKDLERSFCDNEKIDNVAERLGLSRRYFTRLFRKSAGTSWLNYVRNLRLKHAKQLLRSTDRSIAIIAFECGFEDLSSFYRAFKSVTGTSPQRWREGKALGS
jgi:AraC family L-rhamnose operon regulatory protein RhaS